jgi:SAM-dependent methyltransferase
MLVSRKCNLCNETKTQVLFRKNSFNIVKCRNCGLVYVDLQSTYIKIPDLYDFDFFEGNKKSRGYSGYLGEKDNIKRNSKKRWRRIERYQKRGKLLDVGCAAGFFLCTAAENWEVTGVDISEYMSSYARDVLGLNVLTGGFVECNLPSEYFDVITMWDLIEHTQDPAENLAKA